MSRDNTGTSASSRPSTFSSKSFTRFEPSRSTAAQGHRHRASTLESSLPSRLSTEQEHEDVFTKFEPDTESPNTPDLARAQSFPDNFDELPVELISLTDRFIESLGTKAFEQPPSIEQIAELFQEFYIRASTSISIHISTLIARLNREPSPRPSKGPVRSKTLPTKTGDDVSASGGSDGALQMLTASEVTEKRKARRMLEYKRLLLEEAVERRVCDKVYHKIWRHKSTLDEVQDEKLRSKTAALALVGIGLKDLGIEMDNASGKSVEDVQELLVPARDDLTRMNEETCPLGKLQHLTRAHKTIVDTLYSIHGSSSSADEILPTLIYTLITAPVEGINIISNLNFIQRFRTTSKIDGEAAYCMTNLEAAISFLENVDLSTLRADEFPEGPRKSPSQPSTPVTERPDPFPPIPSVVSSKSSGTATMSSTSDARTTLKTSIEPVKPLSSPRHQRTISDLLQPVAAANEAVRLKANEGIENIANTLDNSFKFLFGRLKEQAADPASPKDMIVPKTLDEALQLVSKSPGPEEETAVISETSSVIDREPLESPALDKGGDKLMSLFGGKRAGSIRDRSVDSQKSTTSSRRVTFGASHSTGSDVQPNPKEPNPSLTSQATSLDSVKNLGSSLNPFANFGNALGSGFGRFGRPANTTSAASRTTTDNDKSEMVSDTNRSGVLVESSTTASSTIAKRIRATEPPIKRFVQMEDVSELKIRDVAELLEDYKRLATLLSSLAA